MDTNASPSLEVRFSDIMSSEDIVAWSFSSLATINLPRIDENWIFKENIYVVKKVTHEYIDESRPRMVGWLGGIIVYIEVLFIGEISKKL